jgi:hypothetical protein
LEGFLGFLGEGEGEFEAAARACRAKAKRSALAGVARFSERVNKPLHSRVTTSFFTSWGLHGRHSDTKLTRTPDGMRRPIGQDPGTPAHCQGVSACEVTGTGTAS